MLIPADPGNVQWTIRDQNQRLTVIDDTITTSAVEAAR